MAIREGRWDCSDCGTTGIRGRETACTQCGKPRPSNVKFYLPSNEPEVTDPALLARAKAGANWNCEHCGADNTTSSSTCSNCGAPKGSSPSLRIRDYNPTDVPRESSKRKSQEKTSSTTSNLPVSSGKPNHRQLIAVSSVVLAILIGILVWNAQPRDIILTVSKMTWERSVTVEKYVTVQQDGWNVPAGGRQISSQQAVMTYRDILDHYDTETRRVCEVQPSGWTNEYYNDCQTVQTGTEEYVCGYRDLGNGFFEDIECERAVYGTQCTLESRPVQVYEEVCTNETYQKPVYRKEPIMGTLYIYEIEKWVYGREPALNGVNTPPEWPELDLAENERESERIQKYLIYFVDEKGVEYSQEYDLEQWSAYKVGDSVKAEINRFGNVTIISK